MASKLKELEAQYTSQQKVQQPQLPSSNTSSFWDRLRDLGSRALGTIVTILDAPSNILRNEALKNANEAQKRYEYLRKDNPNFLLPRTREQARAFMEMLDHGRKTVAAGFYAGIASIISPSAWLGFFEFVKGAGSKAVGAGAYAVRDPLGALSKAKEGILSAPQYIADVGRNFLDRPFHSMATVSELAGSLITPLPAKMPVTITRSFKANITGLKAYSSIGDYLPLAKAEPNKLAQMDPLKGWGTSWGYHWLEEHGYFNQLMPIKLSTDLVLKDPEGLNNVMRFQPQKLEAFTPRETVFLVEGKLEPKGLPKISFGRPHSADVLARSPTELLYFHKEVEPGKLSIRAGHVDEYFLRLQSLDLEAGLTGGRFKSIGYLGENLGEKAISWKMAMEDRLGALHEVIEEAAKSKAIKEELLKTRLEHEKLLDKLVFETKLSQTLNDPAKGIRGAEDLLEKIDVKKDVILAGEIREPERILHISRRIEELENYRPRHELKVELSDKPLVREGDIWGVGARATNIEGKIKDTSELYIVAPLKEVEKYIPVEKFAPELVREPIKLPKDLPEVKPSGLGRKLSEPESPRPMDLESGKSPEARAQSILKAVEEKAMKKADELELPVAKLDVDVHVPRGRLKADVEAPKAVSSSSVPFKELPEKAVKATDELELPVARFELKVPWTRLKADVEASKAGLASPSLEAPKLKLPDEMGLFKDTMESPVPARLEMKTEELARTRKELSKPSLAPRDEFELPVAQLDLSVPTARLKADVEAPRAGRAQLDEVKSSLWAPGERTIEMPITTLELPLGMRLSSPKLKKEEAQIGFPLTDSISKIAAEALPVTEVSKASPITSLLPEVAEMRLGKTRKEVDLLFNEEEMGLLPRTMKEVALLKEQDLLKGLRGVYEEIAPAEGVKVREALREGTLLFEEEAKSPRTLARKVAAVREAVKEKLGSRPLHETSLRLYDVLTPVPRLAPELLQLEASSLPSYDVPALPWLEDVAPVPRGREEKTRGISTGPEPLLPRVALTLRDPELALLEGASLEEHPEEGRKKKEKQQEKAKEAKIRAREYLLPEFLPGLTFRKLSLRHGS